MAAVVGTPQIVVLDDEEHVPPEIVAHEADDTGGDVRIGIDAGRIGEMRVSGELGRERSQDQFLNQKLGSG